MRSHRFYTQLKLSQGDSFELPKEAAHHCIQVLRYKVGAELVLFNGDGFDYIAKISAIEVKKCQVIVLEQCAPENESPLHIHLYQGIARGEKMDLIIQKSVELGVSQITPVFTERCNVKLDPKRLAKKQKHWQAVAVSASEQSGRSLIATINPAINIKQLMSEKQLSEKNKPKQLAASENTQSLYLEPTATQRLQDIHFAEQNNNEPLSVALFIGPEGGFSDSDLHILQNNGVDGVKLGPRILRTETAGLACIAILQSHFGDV
jgi:16S rRNA (uracil1498-N3)-methyltransferase